MAPTSTSPRPTPPHSTTLELAHHKLTYAEASAADLAGFVKVFDASFTRDPLFGAMKGSADTEEVCARQVVTWGKDLQKPGRRYFKIVDEATGEIVAIAKWWFPHTYTPEQEAAEAADAAAPKPAPVPGTNPALTDEFVAKLAEGRKKYIVREEMYFMNILGVAPAYQRLGLGAALLAPVLRKADAEGRKTYIEATAAGVGLYRKLGWAPTGDSVTVDLKPYGVDTVAETVLMVREPKIAV